MPESAPLVARASSTVRNKNLIILGMCLLFLCWFAYDGWVRYPDQNDRLVNVLKDSPLLVSTDRPFVESWKGWTSEPLENRQKMDAIVRSYKAQIDLSNWKEVFDVNIQRWIVLGLILANAGALCWLIHCQRRRAIADDKTVSPTPGVAIPWDKITRVDNTRWKSTGIVEITYLDNAGQSHRAKFDDYELDREALLPILDQLGEKAVNAEFIPKEDLEAASAQQPS